MVLLILITLFVFAFLVTLIYQIARGFPIMTKIRQGKRQKRWEERQKTKKENEEKIKLLDKTLKNRYEVDLYISLNRFNFPENEKWKPLLPKMVEDLISIGWTPDMPMYSTYKYGRYSFHIATSNQTIINQAIPIFNTYIDAYEEI